MGACRLGLTAKCLAKLATLFRSNSAHQEHRWCSNLLAKLPQSTSSKDNGGIAGADGPFGSGCGLETRGHPELPTQHIHTRIILPRGCSCTHQSIMNTLLQIHIYVFVLQSMATKELQGRGSRLSQTAL